MKKFFLAVTALFLSVIGIQAQSTQKQGFTFGAGLDLSLPTGNFGTGYTFGVGGQVQGEYMFSDNLSGIASVGYQTFFGKSISIPDGLGGTQTFKNPAAGFIPILVGARYYPSEQFFVGAQIGVGLLSYGSGGGSTSGFDYLPQVGYVSGPIQFVLAYNGLSVTGGTETHLQLSAVYTFGGN